ncbi:MAG: ATP-binding protein, partial [Myxococcota bacterium]
MSAKPDRDGTRGAAEDAEEIQSATLGIVEKLAESVAHDMNNVLASVMGLASVVEAQLEDGSSLASDVQGILAASRKGMEMTRDLMSFARTGDLRRQRLTLNDLVGVVRSFVMRTVTRGQTIDLLLADGATDVEGDPTQIKHALINLVTNAIEAAPDGGTVSLSTTRVTVDGTAAKTRDLREGDYVIVQVGDTGKGMDAKTLERAWEPFFTTKPKGTAAGLGLSLVYRIIGRHRGKVSMFSKAGLGTTVAVYLPALKPPAADRQPPKAAPPKQRATDRGTALIVDDDDLSLAAARRVLQLLGFDVVPMLNGEDAVAYYRDNHAKLELVLLDVIMPGLDGTEVLGLLKEINPDVPVIISSGLPTDDMRGLEQVSG